MKCSAWAKRASDASICSEDFKAEDLPLHQEPEKAYVDFGGRFTRTPEGRPLVVLRAELLTDKEGRAADRIVVAAEVVAVVSLVPLIALKYVQDDRAALRQPIYQIWNTVAASLYLVTLLGMCCWWFKAVWNTHQKGAVWMHRRKTMVVQQSVELVLQFVNVAFYLVPNVYSLVQKCQWGSNVVSACAVVRWSLWFTTFCLQTIGTHNQVFVPQQKKKGSAAGSSWHKPGGHFCIDEPFWRLHWPKILLLVSGWIGLFFFSLWSLTSIFVKDGNCTTTTSFFCLSRPPTPEEAGDCRLYFYYVWKAQKGLKQVQYTSVRVVSMVVNMQIHLRTMSFLIMIHSTQLLWFQKIGTCTALLEIWLGLFPMQTVMLAVVCVSCVLLSPRVDVEARTLQAFQHHYAWSEDDPALAAAGDLGMPMFCFETAIKASAFYWSRLVYRHHDEKPDARYNIQLAKRLHGLEHHKVLVGWSSNSKAPSRIVLSFRGTASMQNLLSDFQVQSLTLTDVAYYLASRTAISSEAGHMVQTTEQRFLQAWLVGGLREQVLACVGALLEKLEPDQRCKILLTGKLFTVFNPIAAIPILGGALAQLAAHDIQTEFKQQYPRLWVSCYALGSPRVGNSAFACTFCKSGVESWSVINDQDAVARGGKFMGLFKRAGDRIFLNQKGDMLVCPIFLEAALWRKLGNTSVRHHMMAAYLKSFAAVIQRYMTMDQASKGGRQALLAMASKPCMRELFQAVFGITKKDLMDYIRAGRRGDLLNKRCWFQGRYSKDGRTLSEELEAEDRLEADKEGAGSSTQAADRIVFAAEVVAVVSLVPLVVLKYAQIWNTVAASLYLAILLGMCCWWFKAVWNTRQKGAVWMHRRKTMVVQQSVELVLQFVNVALYLIPNVYSLVQKCTWAGNLIHLRTMSFLVMIHSTQFLWFQKIGTCTALLEIWLGLFPMQTVMLAIVCVSCVLLSPQVDIEARTLQAFQHHYAWSEEDPALDAAGDMGMPMFCFETAIKASAFYWSRLVYRHHDEKPDARYNVQLAKRLHGLEHHKVLVGWTTKSQAPVRIVLSFRGTASMQNLLSDFQIWRTTWPREQPSHLKLGTQLKQRSKVHKGFLQAWLAGSLREQVLACHSLGGALAQLAAHDIQTEFKHQYPRLWVSCYPLGSPRLGNRAFAHTFHKSGVESWSVINDQDAVARGGKFMGLFKRAGDRIFLNQKGDMLVCPIFLEAALWRKLGNTSVRHHMMAAYLKSFAAVIQRYMTMDQASKDGRQALLAMASKPCMRELFQAVFGITKKDLLDYIRAGSRGDLLNRRCWFQGRNSKDGRTLSQELEAEDRLEADKEGAGSSTQAADRIVLAAEVVAVMSLVPLIMLKYVQIWNIVAASLYLATLLGMCCWWFKAVWTTHRKEQSVIEAAQDTAIQEGCRVQYLYYVWRAKKGLKQVQYTAVLVVSMVVHMQVWLGLFPMQTVMLAVVCVPCVLLSPQVDAEARTLQAFYWSCLVYRHHDKKPDARYNVQLAKRLHGLEHHKVLVGWTTKSQAQARIVLSFRGTASMQNLLSDFQVQWLTFAGFLQAWLAGGLREQVLACHSLGGALAQLAAHDIPTAFKQQYPRLWVSCYPLGSPCVGNRAFADTCHKSGVESWSVINDQDAVARSGKLFGMFKRAGGRVFLDQKGDMLVCPMFLEAALWRKLGHTSVRHHMLAAYLKSFAAVIQRYMTMDQASKDGRQALLVMASKPCMRELFQAVFGITTKDLLVYIRAGSRGDLLNRRCWFQGRNSKDGRSLSEELEAEDRLEADKEGAGSSTQAADRIVLAAEVVAVVSLVPLIVLKYVQIWNIVAASLYVATLLGMCCWWFKAVWNTHQKGAVWFQKIGDCTSLLEVWLGLFPIQTVMLAVVCVSCVLLSPHVDVEARTLQAFQHHYAWSEEDQALAAAGFLQAWLGGGLREQVLACVGALLEELAQDQRCTMLLTGEHFCRLSKPTVTIPCHSLGGALAQLAAHDIQTEFKPQHPRLWVSCYPLGGPRVGNRAFADTFNKSGVESWSVINDQDAVARSGKLFGMFKRAGERIFLNQKGDMLVCPGFLEAALWRKLRHTSVRNHLLAAYLKSFAAVIQRYMTMDQASKDGRQALLAMASKPCMRELLQAVFGITKKDLLDYIRAGSRGDLLNKRCWFQGRNSKNGLTLSEELEADDRLEADKEGAGSSTQAGSLRAHMPDLEIDSGTIPAPFGTDSTDLDADIVGEEVKQAKAILASRSFFRKAELQRWEQPPGTTIKPYRTAATGDARELVTASLDKSLALWRLQDCDLSESRAVPMSEVARLKPVGGPIFSLVADSTSLGNHKQENSAIHGFVGDRTSLGDCNQVFCGNHGKSVLSWEPPDKEMISKVVLNSHTGWVRSLATSGKWLFSCGCNYIKQWDMSRAVPRHVRDIKLFTGDILALCTGNNRLFACTSRGSIKSWTVDKKGELREAAGRDKAHSDRVTSVLWHKGFLYSTSYDGSIKMWDANTMELVGEKNNAHEGQRINCAAVGPDRMLYTGGDDKLVRRWELALLEAPDSSALFCHHYPVRVLAAGKHDTLVSGDSYGEAGLGTVKALSHAQPASDPDPQPPMTMPRLYGTQKGIAGSTLSQQWQQQRPHQDIWALLGAVLWAVSIPKHPQELLLNGALVVCAGNINQERGTKNALKSEKYQQKVGDDRSGVPGDEVAGSPNSYVALAALYAILALPAAVAPHTAADFLFGASAQPHDALHEPLLRLVATGSLAGAAASLGLNRLARGELCGLTSCAAVQIAAKRDSLSESPFQRLNLALIALVTVELLLAASNAGTGGNGSVLSFNGFALIALVLGTSITVAWGAYGKNSEYGLSLKRTGPLGAVKKLQDDVADAPSPRGVTSGAYTALSIILAASGISYIALPQETLNAVFGNVKGEECIFLWRFIGGVLATLLPALAYGCREGEQQGRLNEGSFKAMNLGLAGAGAGHLAVLVPVFLSGTGGYALPALLGLWGFTTVNAGASLLRK
eukprot:jgi/Astpho2/7760/Aster-07599